MFDASKSLRCRYVTRIQIAESVLPDIRTKNQRNPSLWATVPFDLIVSILFSASEILRWAINKYVTVTMREVVGSHGLSRVRRTSRAARPAGSDHYVQNATITRRQIFIEMIAGPLPLRPGHSPEAPCPRLGLSFSIGREASSPTDLPRGNFKHAGQFSFIGEFRRFSEEARRQEGHALECLASPIGSRQTIAEEAMEQAWIKNA